MTIDDLFDERESGTQDPYTGVEANALERALLLDDRQPVEAKVLCGLLLPPAEMALPRK